MVKELTKESFKEEVLASRGKVLVDFYADWCGPCRMLSPIMEEVAKEVTVYKINVDDATDLASSFGIISIPCVILFEDGKEKNRLIGLNDKKTILEMVK